MSREIDPKYSSSDSRITSLIQLIAEKSYGIPIDTDTVKRWEVINSACGAIDDEIDHTADTAERHQVMRDSTAFVGGEVDVFNAETEERVTKATAMRELVGELDDAQKDRFMHNLRKILIVTERIRNEPDVHQLSKLKRVEGQIYSRLFHAVVPQETADNAQYPEFKRTLNKLFRAGNNVDMAMDLPDDAANGRTQVYPSLKNRGILLKDAAYDALGVARRVNLPFIAATVKFERREFHRRTDRKNNL